MSILIQGIEMPETCDDCPFPYVSASYDKYMECPLSKYEPTALKRNDDCPLVEVPPHGRLIDADELINDGWTLQKRSYRTGVINIAEMPLNNPNIHTIIEAEGKE